MFFAYNNKNQNKIDPEVKTLFNEGELFTVMTQLADYVEKIYDATLLLADLRG